MRGNPNSSHGVNNDNGYPVPRVDLQLNAENLRAMQMLNEGGLKNWSKVSMPKTQPITHVIMAVGALLTLGSIVAIHFNRILGIGLILGIFLLLISSILYARQSRQRLNIVRAYCIRGWQNEEVFRVPFGRVLRYSFFTLLPVYCIWCLPVVFGLYFGYTAWFWLAVPFLIISAIFLANFSYTWKDMEIKMWKFWGIQAAAFLIVNGAGLLLYFLAR